MYKQGGINPGVLKGVTANRNITAFSIAIKIPYVIYLVLRTYKLWIKVIYSLLIFLSLFCLSMIQSRASFVAAVLIGLLIFIWTGSSIMPGKVNPVIPEMVMQVSAQVIGNDNTITFSSSNGNFELNTMLPVMAHNLLESIELLTTSTDVFEKKLINDLEANTEKLDENIQKNSILVTALVPVIGYDKSAEVAKEAMSQNKTIKEVLIEKNLISSEEIDELLNIEKLI